jgi:molybdate transport system ATP-binding protein
MLEVKFKRKLSGFNLDVAFSVNQEILAILGPSGSGKTMTLQCIAGLIRPDEGYVKLNNKVLFDSGCGTCLPTQMRKVGLVFQNYALFPHMTVDQNIGYGIRDLPVKEVKNRVAELLDKMNIPKLGDRYPRQLSAGQQQRVAVARALAPEPEVLLLDEPFSALDSLVKERLQFELQTLQRFYKGNMLFVTHDLAEGYKLSSRIAVFESGRIVQHDVKEKVIAFPANHTVARLVGFKNLVEGFIREVSAAGVTVQVPELGGLLKAQNQGMVDLRADQHVTVGIRPEYIQLRDTEGENSYQCTVDQIVAGVTAVNYYFHVNAVGTSRHYLMVILPRPAVDSIRTGQSCYLYLPSEHVVVIKD